MSEVDPNTRAAVQKFVAIIVQQYDVVEVYLYGSRARGDFRPDSDADLAVLLRGEHQEFLSTKMAMTDHAFDVMLDTGILISPLPIWLDEWDNADNYSNPKLLENIRREGVRV